MVVALVELPLDIELVIEPTGEFVDAKTAELVVFDIVFPSAVEKVEIVEAMLEDEATEVVNSRAAVV